MLREWFIDVISSFKARVRPRYSVSSKSRTQKCPCRFKGGLTGPGATKAPIRMARLAVAALFTDGRPLVEVPVLDTTKETHASSFHAGDSSLSLVQAPRQCGLRCGGARSGQLYSRHNNRA
ncbi:hypothetical protein PoB_007483800 [Plakobranchus ocellatus]|uniref:Uncharacterized protein n=1 Tax=Plakobranchus ocellatus TaxID=259542 RepID=A0AAV4DVQ7_9GAST|nr:hypothetical protein PoB_007483800 [Plakobranchus ocellatus]